MEAINTDFVHTYGTTGPVFSSATHPGTLETTWKGKVENAGIELAPAEGVLTTKPFPESARSYYMLGWSRHYMVCCSCSSLLNYKKSRKDIESIGFKVNPYDPCVANRTVNGKQHTATCTWHIDNLISKAKVFHTFIMKGMFLCERGRQDISRKYISGYPNYWAKWRRRLVKINQDYDFLKATQNYVASMSVDDTQSIKWHVDAAFAVHKDYKSHTRATLLVLAKGIICFVSTKQKVNTRSLTEAQLVSVDDILSKVLWKKLFIEAQGHKVTTTNVTQ